MPQMKPKTPAAPAAPVHETTAQPAPAQPTPEAHVNGQAPAVRIDPEVSAMKERLSQYEQLFQDQKVVQAVQGALYGTTETPSPGPASLELPEDRADWTRHHWEQHERYQADLMAREIETRVTSATRSLQERMQNQSQEEQLRARLGVTHDEFRRKTASVAALSPLDKAELLIRAYDQAVGDAHNTQNRHTLVERQEPSAPLPGPIPAPSGGGAPLDPNQEAKQAFLSIFGRTERQEILDRWKGRRS